MGSEYYLTEIGPVSKNFTRAKLLDLCTDKSGVQTGPFGSQLHKDDYVEVGTPIITVEHLGNNLIEYNSETPMVSDEDKERLKKFQLREGDIVFSRVGSVDRRAYVSSSEEGWLFSGRCLRVRVDKKKIHPKYLSYFFGYEGFKKYIRGIAVGATMPSINTKILSDIVVYFPSFNSQVKISEHLSSIDKKITLNREINQTLEQMAQALFKSWFVDFDPVIDNALAAGNPIPDALAERAALRQTARASDDFQPLPDDVRQLFPNEFEESELGWIPKGWENSSVEDELSVKGGSTPSTKNPEFWDDGYIHWTSPKDLSGNSSKIILDTDRKITEAGLEKITSGLLPENTVLMSSRAPVGYLAISKIPIAINQGYIAIPETKRLSQEFVIYWLDSIMEEVKSISGGTTFAEISKKTFRSIKMVVPDKMIVDAFSSLCANYLDKVTLNIEENNSLSELRDKLLPKLISGELRLDSPEVEKVKDLVEAV